MSGQLDWTILPLAVGLCALFAWFFWRVGASMLHVGRLLVQTIQDWPQIRRAMVEQEARSGGRFPFWLRAARVLLIIAMIGLVLLLVWRKLMNVN